MYTKNLTVPNINSVLLNINSSPLFPQPLETFTFCLYEFVYLGSSYKWNPAIFSLLCLAYFTKHVSKIHPFYNMYQNFVPFGGKNTPLCLCVYTYVYTIFYLNIHLWTDSWVVSIFWLEWIMLLSTSVYKYQSFCFQLFCRYTEELNFWDR